MEKLPVVFINCKLFPFIDWIIAGLKLYETRSRNTLKALEGKRVYLAETGRGRRPVVRCSVLIDHFITCDQGAYNALQSMHRVPPGSVYSWQAWTKKKVLYRLTDVQACTPFPVPEGRRHGRVWMEF